MDTSALRIGRLGGTGAAEGRQTGNALGLPLELWLVVLGYLHPADIKSFSTCSRRFRVISFEILFSRINLSPESLDAFENGRLQDFRKNVRHITFAGLRSTKLAQTVGLARLYTSPKTLSLLPNNRSFRLPFFLTERLGANFLTSFVYQLAQYHKDYDVPDTLQSFHVEKLRQPALESIYYPPDLVYHGFMAGVHRLRARHIVPEVGDPFDARVLFNKGKSRYHQTVYPASLTEYSIDTVYFALRDHKQIPLIQNVRLDETDSARYFDESQVSDLELVEEPDPAFSISTTHPNPYLICFSSISTLTKLRIKTGKFNVISHSEQHRATYYNVKELSFDNETAVIHEHLLNAFCQRFPNVEDLDIRAAVIQIKADLRREYVPMRDLLALDKLKKLRLPWPRPSCTTRHTPAMLFYIVCMWLEAGFTNLEEVKFARNEATPWDPAPERRVRACKVYGGVGNRTLKWREEGWVDPSGGIPSYDGPVRIDRTWLEGELEDIVQDYCW
ncbi:hypothetical protein H072_6379 [Dactylellina haptotyla CBS 200.50]|uniref:F-box domain-containing protein n=1 Tax=Dactylellina haptotyla (strain CBS 200.50) TaxID=1284197 RepID=S8AAA0_DACHA|nr:hypothetical protein H072_6379 [Dactylellina haptotyla CBS 200.50]